MSSMQIRSVAGCENEAWSRRAVACRCGRFHRSVAPNRHLYRYRFPYCLGHPWHSDRSAAWQHGGEAAYRANFTTCLQAYVR